MSSETPEDGLDRFAVQLDVAADRVLPWETGTPVSAHIATEGIRHV